MSTTEGGRTSPLPDVEVSGLGVQCFTMSLDVPCTSATERAPVAGGPLTGQRRGPCYQYQGGANLYGKTPPAEATPWEQDKKHRSEHPLYIRGKEGRKRAVHGLSLAAASSHPGNEEISATEL